jgi:hypothetical protein
MIQAPTDSTTRAQQRPHPRPRIDADAVRGAMRGDPQPMSLAVAALHATPARRPPARAHAGVPA